MTSLGHNELTHCGLVTPYNVNIDLGQHWIKSWLFAWWHQAITWTNVDISIMRSSDIHLKSISLKNTLAINQLNWLEYHLSEILFQSPRGQWVNITIWLMPGNPYMCLWTMSSWIQLMACCLLGSKPLPDSMLIYFKLDLKEQASVKF